MSSQHITSEASSATQVRPKRPWPWMVGGICLASLAMLFLSLPATIWDGAVQRRINIQVTDISTNYPISGATVTLMRRGDEMMKHLDPLTATTILQQSHQMAMTDVRGLATVTGRFGAGGTSSALWRSGTFDADGILTISHPNYRSTEGPLPNFLQRREFPLRTKSFDLHIFLVAKFRD